MSVTDLANRYAESFCDIAQDQGELDEAVDSLKNLAEAIEPARDVIFANPEVSTEEQHQVLDRVFDKIGDTNDSLLSLIERFCRLLIDKNRIQYLSEIADASRDEADQLQNRKRASVRTPYSLDQARKKSLRKKLGSQFDADILLEEQVDPDLIAGLQIQIEDYLMDHTVRNKIEKFYEKFSRT